jgi:hypothetical protein
LLDLFLECRSIRGGDLCLAGRRFGDLNFLGSRLRGLVQERIVLLFGDRRSAIDEVFESFLAIRDFGFLEDPKTGTGWDQVS